MEIPNRCEKSQAVNSFDKIKLMADSRRMDILRVLMGSPATHTRPTQTLKQSPHGYIHHVLALEFAGLVEISEITKGDKNFRNNL